MNENEEKKEKQISEIDPNLKTYSFGYRIKSFFKQKICVIVLAVGCIFFIFKDAIKWKINDANLLVLIVSMMMTFFFTMYVVIIMGKMGLKSGKDSATFKATMKYYSEEKEKIEPIRSHLSKYCKYKSEQDKKSIQRDILEAEGLELDKLYDYDITDSSNLTKDEIKAVIKARKEKGCRLLEKDLISERGFSNKAKYGTYLGKTERDFEKQRNLKTSLSKLLIPIALTYIGIESIAINNLLSGCIKTTIILFSGLSNYLASEEFVINELRNRFINKADCLVEFRIMWEQKDGCFAYLKEEENETIPTKND